MAAYPRYDITITEGADFTLSLQLTSSAGVPLDLTGCQVDAQIREDFDQSSAVLRQLNVHLIAPETGELYLTLSAAQTLDLYPAAHPQRPRSMGGYYDIRITDAAGKIGYVLGGRVIYYQTITRSAP